MKATVWISINMNKWGSPSVRVFQTKEEAHTWGEQVLKNAYKVLDIHTDLWLGKTFREGETLSEAPEFTYYIQKEFFIPKLPHEERD